MSRWSEEEEDLEEQLVSALGERMLAMNEKNKIFDISEMSPYSPFDFHKSKKAEVKKFKGETDWQTQVSNKTVKEQRQAAKKAEWERKDKLLQDLGKEMKQLWEVVNMLGTQLRKDLGEIQTKVYFLEKQVGSLCADLGLEKKVDLCGVCGKEPDISHTHVRIV